MSLSLGDRPDGLSARAHPPRGRALTIAEVETVGAWAERHQVPLYLAAVAAGGLVGGVLPAIAPALGTLTTPALVLLLTATFLAVPLRQVRDSVRRPRFLVVVLVLNFVLVPAIAFLLSRAVADDPALLLGVLLVLLTPCIDYVIVFTGLAGGARASLLAATPVLLLAQLALLPGYLALMAGPDAVARVEVGPFLEAFVLFVALPLAAAAFVQHLGRSRPLARRVQDAAPVAGVPLLVLTLLVVVGSQTAAVGPRIGELALLVPLYGTFAVLAAVAAVAVARIARLDVAHGRAAVFSTVTRNSLVVLPLALALPAGDALTPLAVVTQTVVEMVVMVLLVRLLPRFLPRST